MPKIMHVDRVTVEIANKGGGSQTEVFAVTADPGFFEMLGGDFQDKKVLIRYLDKVYAR